MPRHHHHRHHRSTRLWLVKLRVPPAHIAPLTSTYACGAPLASSPSGAGKPVARRVPRDDTKTRSQERTAMCAARAMASTVAKARAAAPNQVCATRGHPRQQPLERRHPRPLTSCCARLDTSFKRRMWMVRTPSAPPAPLADLLLATKTRNAQCAKLLHEY